MSLVKSDYLVLVEKIRKTLVAGRARAEEAVDKERTRTYWEIGRDIHHYSLHGRDRAKYGENLLETLSDDLELSKTLVYDTLSFYRAFPIFHARGKLPWTCGRLLLRIKDKKQRLSLANKVLRKKWKTRQLETEIHRLRLPLLGGLTTDSTPGVKKLFHPGSGVGFKPLVPRCGEFFHYKVVRSQDLHLGKDVLGLDLGFGNKHFPDFTLRNLKEGEILHVVRTKKSSTGDSYRFERAKPSVNRTPSGTFFHTYQAWVKNVVDDDTLWTEIDVGFRNTAEQKLRLRGINAAEIEKAKPASDFVKRTLAKVPFVVLSILGRDKFGRPLTDLFYLEGTDDRDKVAREGIYLNQQLLDLGLAVRMDD